MYGEDRAVYVDGYMYVRRQAGRHGDIGWGTYLVGRTPRSMLQEGLWRGSGWGGIGPRRSRKLKGKKEKRKDMEGETRDVHKCLSWPVPTSLTCFGFRC